MKKIFLQTMFIALLSAVGVSQAWGQSCLIDYDPQWQGVGDLSFYNFDYQNQDDLCNHAFGHWNNDNKGRIGWTSYGTNRYFDMWLTLPEAGIYAITFMYGSNESAGSVYQASIQEGACTMLDGGTAKNLSIHYTGSPECYSVMNGHAMIELRAQEACSVKVRLQHVSGNMDEKDFKLIKGTEAAPAYQGLGDLDIAKFVYAGTGAPTVNFGRWYEKDYIGSFKGKNDRNVTFKLDLPSSGTYKIKFNTAYAPSDNCTYKASTTTSGCSITTDYGEGEIHPSHTGGEENFTQTHWINVTTGAAGNVDVVLTHGSNDTANFKNFELQKEILVDANQGQCPVSSFYSDGAVLGGLPTAVRQGYALKGWYTAAIGGEKVTESTPCATINTIYAQWEDNSDYKAITSNTTGLQWNEDYSFISGLYETDITAVWADNGNAVNGHTRAVNAGQTVVMKFPAAYKYVTSTGTTYYDIYAAVTPSENINNTWTARIESASPLYLKIMPKDMPQNFFTELWLQEGSAIAEDVEFIAGHCYVNTDEYVSIFGTEPIVNSNLARTNNFDYNETEAGWTALRSTVNKPQYYLIGNGYTADHHVRIAYHSATSGRNCEITMGYLNCTYTFHYPSEPSTAPTRSYRMNQEVKLSEDALSAINTRQGWEITAGKVALISGDTLNVNDIINVLTRDQIQVIDNATLQGYAPFNVTFDPNATGATVSPTTKSVEMGGYYGELPTPVGKDNFIGWYTDAEEGTLVTDETIVMTKTAHTLYAHWEPNIVSDGTDSTYTAAQNEVNTKLAAWATRGVIDVTVKRTIYKDGCYNTICLPFDLTNAQIVEAFGEYTALKQFVSATVKGEESNRSLVIELEEVTNIEAGKPYLISFASGANLPQVTFKDVTVTATEPETVGEGDVTFNGILTPVILQYENHNLLFVGGNNKLYWPLSDGKFTRGFRAYFEVSTASSVIARGMKAVFGEKTTPTGNTNIKSSANEIKKLIKEGRVVILCDGVKYDLNGNILK